MTNLLLAEDGHHIANTTGAARWSTGSIEAPSPAVSGASWKRAADVTIALVALLVFLPLMIIIAMMVRADGGPSLFGHSRIGVGGRSFRCLKFRSMVVDSEARLAALLASDPEARAEWARDHKLRRDPRITAFGAFLRKSSLDELPQLINVLRGDMSIVGPRPIVAAEGERYGRYLADYARVRPGITGLWQVSGRNDTSYRRRVAIDVLYSRRCSLLLDAQILVRTVPAVLMSKGSY